MTDWMFFRSVILAVGWPLLIVGSSVLVFQSARFFVRVGRTSFGRLVLVMALGWLVTMYALGVTATAFMWTNPARGVPVVLPVFLVWFSLMVLVAWSVGRWTLEVGNINAFYRRLEEANRTKTDLINRASHELSTPITPLKIQVELLKNSEIGPLNPRQERALTIIDRNVERLAYMVREMMDVSRIQTGHLTLLRETVDLAAAVSEAVDSFTSPAVHQGLKLEVHLAERLEVEADPVRISQVLQILLSNAVKFSPPGGRVTVTARVQYGKAVVLVEDTGIGFHTEETPKLFQAFSQLPNAGDLTQAGAGLGLYIARRLIDEHEGSIWAESPGLGRGATFGFALPLRATIFEEDAKAAPAAPKPLLA